ncbi:TPA: histidine kinase [Vibrio cholerae]|nr:MULTISPECIES: histidine kinase [Vibrio]EGR5062603.1 histidine kinase [Vibrio cholerae]ELJ8547731.1 histidine kinase [Vibrio cholerae]ELT7568988.1 histidine kinase [Vibrio cholerae]ELY5187350.1 histidine kinase [Vibrio cholerae]ELY5287995.1 histidine kinase [Vibrio cholerae]
MKSVTDKLVLNITVFEQEKSIKKNIREKTAQIEKQRRLAALLT